MTEIEIAYELVRQGVWTPEDLQDWMHARCRSVFRHAWNESRKAAKREYETTGEVR